MNIRRILQVFAYLIGNVFRLFPRRTRFSVARHIALALAPLLRRTRYYARRPSPLDGPREEMLRILMRTMTRAEVPFDIDVEFRGEELMPSGGVIVVSAHFLLNVLISRWAHDHGRTFTGILGGEREPLFYAGTLVPLELIYVGPTVLIQARRKIREGSILFCDIDNPEANDRRRPIDDPGGRRYVSPALLKFAARTRTPVVFAATYFDEQGRVIVTYARPSSDEPDAMMEEFLDFFRTHAARVQR